MKTVLGIDLGTQSLKLLCYDFESKHCVASATAPLDVHQRDDGTAEQEAGDWLLALKTCCAELPDSIKSTIAAIGVSGQQHGLVALDAEHKVIRPVKLWCDTSTQAEASELEQRLGGKEAAIAATGNPVLTGYTLPKVLWLKEHEPENYQRLAHILLPHDYLNFVLTGEYAMEYGDASGTGLLDVRSRTWSKQVLDALDSDRDMSSCLPPLIEPHEFIGETSKEFAENFGLPAGIPVAVGGGDNMMGAIGTGAVIPGRVTMSLGSSGTLFSYSDSPIVDPEGEIAAFCSSTGGWLPLLCTMNCTLGTELIRNALGMPLAEIDHQLAEVPPTSDGLLVIPFFAGERTPNLPQARGTMFGMSRLNTQPAHLLRATMEGSTYSIYRGVEKLRELGVATEAITLTGGGARSQVWRQMVADICQLPVDVPLDSEGACFGAALQALWVLQKQKHPELELVDITNAHIDSSQFLRIEPNPQHKEIYQQGYANFLNALPHVRAFYH